MSTRSREVRLGVVMFGGVSLAVYINGVAQELFRAVRGRGVYRLLKALTDSDIVVDILSGASAGGINSVLLSAALCNGTELGSTANLWRESADIESLLSIGEGSAHDSQGAPAKSSVLDGAFFHEQLRAALAQLLGSPTPSNELEDVSTLRELDLFVTATDIDGQKGVWFDALKHPIQLQDHRTLFRLKHRDRRNLPFARNAAGDGWPCDPSAAEINIEALTTLSHITSCFPGAFEPLKVTIPARPEVGENEHFTSPAQAVNARLSYWGALQPFQDEQGRRSARQAIFMDGGVLENKPFTSTISAIFSRLADRQVSRYLLYVDPDPKALSFVPPVHPDRADPARRLLPVAYAAASGLPRFESIDGDLARVEQHNRQVQRYEALVKEATAAALADPRATPSLETPATRAYRRARIAGLAAEVVAGTSGDPASAERSRPGQRAPLAKLWPLIDALCQCPEPRLSELFAQFDVLFGFRRLIQLTYLVDDYASVGRDQAGRSVSVALPGKDPEQVEHFQIDRRLLSAINRQIELYEVVRARLASELSGFVRSSMPKWGEPQLWLELAERARAVLRRLPRPSCFAGTKTGTDAGEVSAEELDALHGLRQQGVAAPEAEDQFLLAAEAFERSLLAGTDLRRLYECFPQIDEVAYPLELVSELRGRDFIRTVRVSPLDSKRGFAQEFTHKLCGDKLAAFGAFFKASWRANDLLWGRLDALTQLLDLLLDPKRLARLDPRLLESNLQASLGEAFDLRPIFPHLPEDQRSSLERWLRLVSSSDAETARAAREALDDGSRFRESWARAAQLEILVEELPRVLEHALSEAAGDEKLQLTEQLKALTSKSPLAVGASVAAYFNPRSYRIAEQTLPGALPPARLRAILSQSSAHLKDALLASLPSDTLRAAAIRSAANATLSVALRVVSLLWEHGKVGRH